MELEILDLIYDYSVKGNLFDSKFINKLIEIVVAKKDMKDYVKDVSFDEELEGVAPPVVYFYCDSLRRILVDLQFLRDNIEKISCSTSLPLDFEKIMFKNVTATQMVLHKLERPYQHKQINDNSNNSIESKLIKASLAVKDQEFSEDKTYFASLFPTERMAKVNSFRTMVLALEPIKRQIPNLFELENKQLSDAMLVGYAQSWSQDTNKCPTEFFFRFTGQGEVWSQLDFYDSDRDKLNQNVQSKYDLPKRLTLGLPVFPNDLKYRPKFQ